MTVLAASSGTFLGQDQMIDSSGSDSMPAVLKMPSIDRAVDSLEDVPAPVWVASWFLTCLGSAVVAYAIAAV